MLAIPLLFGLGILLVSMVSSVARGDDRRPLMGIVVAGFLVRPVLFLTVMRSLSFFSHGRVGGDSVYYQRLGSVIARRWLHEPIHFVTESELPRLGSAALPCNVLALLEYVGGEPQPLAGTVINAFLACWMVVILYGFLRERGVEARLATWFSAITLFSPAFLFHTSDTYKDGVNAFLVLTSLVLSMRLAVRFEATRLVQLAMCLGALWFVRHYMVFMSALPLVLGIIGQGRSSRARQGAAVAFVGAMLLGMYVTGAGSSVLANAEATFEYATSETALSYNSASTRAGSGVVTSSLPERLVYTVFAPFPWQSGSFGFHLGKIEALIAYAYLYLIYRHRRALWEHRRTELLMIALLVVPGLVAYAMTMSNVGLVVRQRLPLMFALGLLTMLGYPSRAAPVRSVVPSTLLQKRARMRELRV